MGIGEDATDIYERLMPAQRSIYSVEDLRYMRTVYELARCYVERYRCQEGEALLEPLLTICEQILGAEHQHTLDYLARCDTGSQKFDETEVTRVPIFVSSGNIQSQVEIV